jgi:predicted Fe-Mo cluster-binding NifX family protein
MKICVPTLEDKGLDSQISPHFGRAPKFIVSDTDLDDELEVLDNTAEHFGGMAKTPEIIRDAGVDAILVSGIGPRAIRMFEQMGIRVFAGASGTAGDALEDFHSGILQEATDEDACAEHHK